MALIAVHGKESGKTDRDRDVGIFQSFTDEVSPGSWNVGILANNNNSHHQSQRRGTGNGSLAFQISSETHRCESCSIHQDGNIGSYH